MLDTRYSFLIYCLLAFFAAMLIASEQQGPTDFSARQLRKDKRKRTELQRLIEQIRSIRFEPKNQRPEPVPPQQVKSVPKTEPNKTLSTTEAPQQPTKEKETEFKPDSQSTKGEYEPISDQTLRMLENLSKHPDQLHNPLGLAEILFAGGHLKQAVMFYQLALNRKDPNDVTLAQDRAWILFQIGNCLRDDDLPGAKKVYRQLIEEYPNFFWADLAKAQEKLIDWYLKDKPTMLIAECKF